MRTSKELYKDLPGWVLDIQKSIAEVKIECAKAKLKELQKVPFKQRDDLLINDVIKAIKHNKYLMEEK